MARADWRRLCGATFVATSLILAQGAAAQTAAKPAKVASAQTAPKSAAKAEGGLPAFLQSLWPLAQARGISRATFDTALRGLSLDGSIVALTKKQAEFGKPIWSYLAGAVSSGRVGQGQAMAGQWASALARAEASYGVPREIVLGIWGMETSYGGFKGDKDVIRSLATLAYVRYRGDFFRDELLTALEILDKGHAERAELRGSWAGAMGHTQFMPSSYMKYAVDASGDGHADIWSNPTDAIASTANYLKGYGWQAGLPWGVEVVLPQGMDISVNRRSFSAWASAGLRKADGGALPWSGEATLFLPAGIKGPALLITENYAVIKKYNNSDAYALAVAVLGDRIAGRGGLRADWPLGEPQLSPQQRMEVQRRLKALGLYSEKIDGRLGSGTREAVRQFQLRAGLTPDGHASPAVLARLKAAK